MPLDAIIISQAGTSSYSGTNPLKLSIDGHVATVQNVSNYLKNNGHVVGPVEGDHELNWASAPKFNGIVLFNHLTRHRFTVDLVDNYHRDGNRFERLVSQAPKAIIVSTTFIHDKSTLTHLVEDIRQKAPDTCIIAGGPFVYASYRIMLRSGEPDYLAEAMRRQFLFLESEDEPDVDIYVVSRQGETALRDILARLKNGRRPEDIPNTATRRSGAYRFSRRLDDVAGHREEAIDWSGLPSTCFDSGVMSLSASTGCPFHCAFCNFIKDRRLNRVKPLDRLVSDMKALSRKGIRYVWFVDDNFRLGKRDLEQVCRRFIDEGIDLNWLTFVRADAIEHVDPVLLKDAGCQEVQLGLESADPQILRNMNKQSNPRSYANVLTRLRSVGIHCSCYFIFGFPGETPQTAQRTRDFIKCQDRLALEGDLSFSLFPFILSPLSPIFEPEQRRRYALSGYMTEWSHGSMDCQRAKHEIVETFMDMKRSGAIYRGDNQEMLRQLGPEKRREFMMVRNDLSRTALIKGIGAKEICRAFRPVVPVPDTAGPTGAPRMSTSRSTTEIVPCTRDFAGETRVLRPAPQNRDTTIHRQTNEKGDRP